MFELTVGTIWCLLSVLLCTMFFYGSEMSVGGIIAMMIFSSIGIIIFLTGLKRLIINILNFLFGRKTYGVVANVYGNGATKGNKFVIYADVMIVDKDGNTRICTDELKDFDYTPGEYVTVKCLGKDFNNIAAVSRKDVPMDIIKTLEGPFGLMSYQPGSKVRVKYDKIVEIYGRTPEPHFLEIDGVEFKRED